ncbi:hypothetical protein Tco_0803047 [Tanacetum coccineum]|uniref:RNA-directed DNA polymerase, eukaryota, reverse transcriptase zinc-binding domain protein n=1 Tax=Tanacetum coccineum TaxID=301880 RepID=A0ABQ5A0G9_9ASTR
MVKNEFLNHFKNRFDRPKSVRPMLNMEFPHHLNSMQQLDLEAEVSNEEIKKAVWDCGVDKSPGPDGFTFGFYKRFWSLIDKRIVGAVKYFLFIQSSIPKGCNVIFHRLISEDTRRVMDAGHVRKALCLIPVMALTHIGGVFSINLSKSKLLGVVVSEDRVVQAANRIGCGVLKAPFAYLGSKVGGNMSRIKSWDEIVDKMVDPSFNGR